MAIALALMSWLSVAMELSLIRFGTARRRSDDWSTDAWIGYRLGRRKTRRHLDRLGVPKRMQRFLGSCIQPSVAVKSRRRCMRQCGRACTHKSNWSTAPCLMSVFEAHCGLQVGHRALSD